jgi:hypothetical protein
MENLNIGSLLMDASGIYVLQKLCMLKVENSSESMNIR